MGQQSIPVWAQSPLNNLERHWVGENAIGDCNDMWQMIALQRDTNTVVVRGRTVDTIAVVQGGPGPTTVCVWNDSVEYYVDCGKDLYTPINTKE